MLTFLMTVRRTAYQSEIDNLTRRSKVAENAFLSVYKLLAEAPDPYPLLDAAVVRSPFASVPPLTCTDPCRPQDQAVSASEAKILEAELARSREETAQLKQQLADVAGVEKEKRKLQERVEKLEGRVRRHSLFPSFCVSPARD
jgi:homeobox protein cut-like